jgi:hypothetical protein
MSSKLFTVLKLICQPTSTLVIRVQYSYKRKLTTDNPTLAGINYKEQ